MDAESSTPATTTDDDSVARERALLYNQITATAAQQRLLLLAKRQRRRARNNSTASLRSRAPSGDAPDTAHLFINNDINSNTLLSPVEEYVNINQSDIIISTATQQRHDKFHWTRPPANKFSYCQLGAKILQDNCRQQQLSWRTSSLNRNDVLTTTTTTTMPAKNQVSNNLIMFGPDMARRKARETRQTLDKILSTSLLMSFGATASAGAAAMNATLSENDRNRIDIAKAIAESAMRDAKVFRIMGNYPPIRRALRERGWVENIFYNSKFHDLAAEEDGLVGMLARLVRDAPLNFVWRTTRPKRTGFVTDPSTFSTPTYLTFTSKVGLCRSLRKLDWNFNFSNELISPRTYIMSDVHEKAHFLQDFKLTTCLAIIRRAYQRMRDMSSETATKSDSLSMNMMRDTMLINAAQNVTSDNDEFLSSNNASAFTLRAQMLLRLRNMTNFERLLTQMPLNVKTFSATEADAHGVPDSVTVASIMYVMHRFQMQNDCALKAALAKRISWFRDDDWNQLYQWNQFAADTAFKISYDAGICEACRCVLLAAAQLDPMSLFDGVKNIWIIKPGAQSRGRGITLSNNIDEIWKTCGFSSSTISAGQIAVTTTAPAVSPPKPTMQTFVLQKYIERPFLIANTKFDIRQWLLVQWHPVRVWIYNDCYLRFSSRYFDLADFNEAVHLTNNAIQGRYMESKTNTTHIPSSCMWTRDQFLKYLKYIGIDPSLWHERIFPTMIQYLCQAVEANISEMDLKKHDNYELFGADFMLTEDLRPWLIEINAAPALSPTTNVTDALCTNVLEDAVKVLIDYRQNHNEQACGKFSLVWELNPVEVCDREYTQCFDYRIMDALSVEEVIPSSTKIPAPDEEVLSESSSCASLNDEHVQKFAAPKKRKCSTMQYNTPSSHYLKRLAEQLKQQLADCAAQYNVSSAERAAAKRSSIGLALNNSTKNTNRIGTSVAKVNTGLNRIIIKTVGEQNKAGASGTEQMQKSEEENVRSVVIQQQYEFSNSVSGNESDCASDDDDSAQVHRELIDIMMTRNSGTNSLANSADISALTASSRALLQQLYNSAHAGNEKVSIADRPYETSHTASSNVNDNATQYVPAGQSAKNTTAGGDANNESRNLKSSRHGPIILLKPSIVKRSAFDYERAALRKMHRSAKQCCTELKARLNGTPEERKNLLSLGNIVLPGEAATANPPETNLVPWELLLKFVDYVQSNNPDNMTTFATRFACLDNNKQDDAHTNNTKSLKAFLNDKTSEHEQRQEQQRHSSSLTTPSSEGEASSHFGSDKFQQIAAKTTSVNNNKHNLSSPHLPPPTAAVSTPFEANNTTSVLHATTTLTHSHQQQKQQADVMLPLAAIVVSDNNNNYNTEQKQAKGAHAMSSLFIHKNSDKNRISDTTTASINNTFPTTTINKRLSLRAESLCETQQHKLAKNGINKNCVLLAASQGHNNNNNTSSSRHAGTTSKRLSKPVASLPAADSTQPRAVNNNAVASQRTYTAGTRDKVDNDDNVNNEFPPQARKQSQICATEKHSCNTVVKRMTKTVANDIELASSVGVKCGKKMNSTEKYKTVTQTASEKTVVVAKRKKKPVKVTVSNEETGKERQKPNNGPVTSIKPSEEKCGGDVKLTRRQKIDLKNLRNKSADVSTDRHSSQTKEVLISDVARLAFKLEPSAGFVKKSDKPNCIAKNENVKENNDPKLDEFIKSTEERKVDADNVREKQLPQKADNAIRKISSARDTFSVTKHSLDPFDNREKSAMNVLLKSSRPFLLPMLSAKLQRSRNILQPVGDCIASSAVTKTRSALVVHQSQEETTENERIDWSEASGTLKRSAHNNSLAKTRAQSHREITVTVGNVSKARLLSACSTSKHLGRKKAEDIKEEENGYLTTAQCVLPSATVRQLQDNKTLLGLLATSSALSPLHLRLKTAVDSCRNEVARQQETTSLPLYSRTELNEDVQQRAALQITSQKSAPLFDVPEQHSNFGSRAAPDKEPGTRSTAAAVTQIIVKQ